MIQVKSILQKIAIGGKVVLHGMTGSGKSSLAAGVMDSDLVLNTFDNKVFWINVGKADDEKILRLMYRLYFKLGTSNGNLYHENGASSIEDMQLLLKNRIFKEDPRNINMLLILDNVSDRKVVKAFDVGCKTLITTQNRDAIEVVEDTHFCEVTGTFKKEESLALFAKCLDKPLEFVKNIPQASQIHDLCKGHPMNIALFGSQMVTYREELLNGKRWDYFVRILEKKKYLDKQISAIKSCLESLDENLRDKYEDLCVFPEDVNISSTVLETIWNLNETDVGNIMMQLENKSLIVSYYSNYHNTYIYGIHVVLLDYLKHSTTVDKIKRHCKLISAYERVCNSNYAKLPNDNYIFQYIGYHLQQAKLFDKFVKVYFDLNFIGAKIKATGIGDLLKDFKIYEKEIVGDHRIQTIKQKLNELRTFVNNCGQDLYKFQDTSIIQCGLKQPKDSFVFKSALEIAKEDNSGLYFKVQPSQQSYSGSFSLPKDSSVACFAKNESELLIGTEDGDIQLWEQTYRRPLCKFEGHDSKIIYLEVNQDRNKFLSLSEDGTLRLWNLDDTALRQNFGNGVQRIPSPFLKQSGYKNFFGGEIIIEQSTLFSAINNDQLTCAAFSNDYDESELIVTGSVNGFVTIWKNKIEEKIYDIRHPIDFVKFSFDDLLIIASSDKELFLLDAKGEQKLSKSCKSSVRSILIAEDDSFVTLHDNVVSLWTYESRKMPGEPVPNVNESVLYQNLDVQVLCGAFNDERLYVTSEGNSVRVFDLKSGNLTDTYSEKSGSVVSIDVLPYQQREVSFLYRFDNNVWEIKPQVEDKLRTTYLSAFSCFWAENVQNSAKPRLALVNTEKRIQIMNSFNLLNETDTLDSPVKAICFSHCGNKVAYGLESGWVLEYEIKTRQYQKLMNMHSSVTFLKYFADDFDATEFASFQGECKGLLVATGQNGKIMINRCGRSLCLMSPSSISKVPIKPIVYCFYVRNVQALLTVSDNRCIKLWYLNGSGVEVLKPEKIAASYFIVTMASMTNDFLAITTSDNIFEVYQVQIEDNKAKLSSIGGHVLKVSIRSCSFSYDAKYLAVGCEDGSIMIYNTSTNKNYTTLQLHKAAVRYLVFSPNSELILVSIGEQIAWWNIEKIPDHLKNRRSYRKSIKANKDSAINNITSQLSTLNLKQWNNKVGPANKPHLLRTFKLQGSHADYIAASPNFNSFVTIDDSGKIYILEMLEQS